LGVTYLHEIDKQILSNFVAERRKTVKNGTINRELSIISAIKNLADEFWEVKTNKANPLKFKLAEPAENIKYLKDWDIAQAIIDKAPTHLKPIIYTAATNIINIIVIHFPPRVFNIIIAIGVIFKIYFNITHDPKYINAI
jgi:hypothetical protein